MTTPDGQFPDDAISGDDLSALDGLDEASWREGLNDRVIGQPGTGNGFNALGGLLDAIGNALGGIASGGFLGGFLDGGAQQIQDMQDSTQKFEGVQVYGARYMPNDMGPTTSMQRAPFTGNIHSGVGVTYSGSEIVLNSRGLYKVDAQCFFSWVVGAGNGCYMDIVVRAPNGSEFSRKPAISRATNTITVFNSHTFGVPAAGYRVSVEVATDSSIVGATRVILGGKGYTSLVVNKWSSEPE